MSKNILFLLALAILFPASAFAHETRMYEINGVPYEIVVGSLNEPVFVDDKTGVSVELVRDGKLLVGAQETLQVEMISGDVKRIVNLSPVYGAEGQYKSPFIATVPTTLTYRVFGTLENVPVDLSFTCNPAGHPQSEENVVRTDLSKDVVQTLVRGAFGCPQPKEAFGFPEPAPSSFVMDKTISELENNTNTQQEKNLTSHTMAFLALILSLLALCVAGWVYKKRS